MGSFFGCAPKTNPGQTDWLACIRDILGVRAVYLHELLPIQS